ncbi:MAG TPA: hypothetical protein VMP01_07865 [Pirellulaceae bacterium]|nr:hypothetical protein [Pirellulaceae bacterium]
MNVCPRRRTLRTAMALLVVILLAARLGAQEANESEPVNPLRSPAAAERLPWDREPPKKSLLRLRPIAGPREFLTRYGIVASQWDSFQSGQPLSAAEEEVVIRLLHLYSRFGQENVEAWTKDELTPQVLADSAEEQRGEIVHLSGKVRRLALVKLIPEVATRYEFSQYYQVVLQIEGGAEAILYCRELPAAWQLDVAMNEQASAYGLFLKLGDEQASSPLLLVTDRVAWLPAEPRPTLGVTPAHVALASLGVDIGRLQAVGLERRAGLTAVDREPFYQILSALEGEQAAKLLTQKQPLNLAALLQEPQEHTGDVLPVRGLARRVLRVDVPDVDIRRRFGIDHYFEVDLSLPLEQTIKLGADPIAKNQAVVYEHSFPATICIRELPPGLAVGDDVRQSIEASAVFFKLWLYHSAYAKEAGLAQPAPLFLARSVQVVADEKPSLFVADVVVGLAMAIAALVFVGIVLWYRWTDRAAKPTPPADAAAKPDFSDLR